MYVCMYLCMFMYLWRHPHESNQVEKIPTPYKTLCVFTVDSSISFLSCVEIEHFENLEKPVADQCWGSLLTLLGSFAPEISIPIKSHGCSKSYLRHTFLLEIHRVLIIVGGDASRFRKHYVTIFVWTVPRWFRWFPSVSVLKCMYQLLQLPQVLTSCSESPTLLLRLVNDHFDSSVLCRGHQRSRSQHPSTATVVGLRRMARMGLGTENQSQNAVGLILEALTWKSVRDTLWPRMSTPLVC